MTVAGKARVSLNSLAVRRGGHLLVTNFSLRAQSGDIIQFVGPNGCGKTSVLRVLAQRDTPEAGHVVWQENHGNVFDEPWDMRADPPIKPLYLGTRSGFDEHLTIAENLLYLGALEGQKSVQTREHLACVLRKMDLTHIQHEPFYRLSTGQRQRGHLARLALLKERWCWLLDEPTTGLDEAGEFLFERLCDDHRKQGGVIFLASPRPLQNIKGSIIYLSAFQKPRTSQEEHALQWTDL